VQPVAPGDVLAVTDTVPAGDGTLPEPTYSSTTGDYRALFTAPNFNTVNIPVTFTVTDTTAEAKGDPNYQVSQTDYVTVSQ
jgi:hypothetical protein